MALSQSSQASKSSSTKKSGNCLGTLLKIAAIILCIYGYSLVGQNYVSQHVVVVENNAQKLAITATRGQPITLQIRYANDGTQLLASPSGVHLTLDGVNEPLQVIAPMPIDWKPGDTVYRTIIGYKDTAPATVDGTITLPSSIGGPEQRTLQGRLQGTIVQPFSRTNVDKPIQIQLVSQGDFLWSGGQLLFDSVAGIGILFALVLLALEARRLILAHKTGPKKPPLAFYLTIFVGSAVVIGGLSFLVQSVTTYYFMGAPGNVGSWYPGEISPLTYTLSVLLGMYVPVFIIRLFVSDKL